MKICSFRFPILNLIVLSMLTSGVAGCSVAGVQEPSLCAFMMTENWREESGVVSIGTTLVCTTSVGTTLVGTTSVGTTSPGTSSFVATFVVPCVTLSVGTTGNVSGGGVLANRSRANSPSCLQMRFFGGKSESSSLSESEGWGVGGAPIMGDEDLFLRSWVKCRPSVLAWE